MPEKETKEEKRMKELTPATISKDLADAIKKLQKEGESFADTLDRVFFTIVEKVKAVEDVKSDTKISDIADKIKEKYMLAGDLISLKQLEKALQDSIGLDSSALDDDRLFKRLERLMLINAMMKMFGGGGNQSGDADTKIQLAKIEAKLEALTNQQRNNDHSDDKTEQLLAYIDSKFNELLDRMKEKQETDGLAKLKEAKKTIEEYTNILKELGVSQESADKWKEEAIEKLISTLGNVGSQITEKISKQNIPPPPSMQPPTPPTPPVPQIPPEVFAHLQQNLPFQLIDGTVVVPLANKNVINAIAEYVGQGIQQEIAGHKTVMFTGEVAKKVSEIIQKL